MTLKQALGFMLLFCGLAVAIGGFARRAPETVKTKINGYEVVLKNSARQNANWQAWLGFFYAGIGIAVLAFPSQETIRNTQ